ncbi:hypothetical protein ACKWTF_012491 [Chironomus riparius]
MPTNSVYQPTTVTFENSNSLIAQTRSSSRLKIIFHKTWMKILLLIGGLLFLAVGLVIFCLGTIDYEDSMTNDGGDMSSEFPREKEFDITLIILGVFFASLGFVLLGIYIKLIEHWRRNCIMICPCSDRRKHRLVRQLQGHNGTQNIMALNPSTDPLVSHTQYEVSVSDVPRFEDEEERKKLMHDKDCIMAEESQLLADSDPRIILKPSTQE